MTKPFLSPSQILLSKKVLSLIGLTALLVIVGSITFSAYHKVKGQSAENAAETSNLQPSNKEIKSENTTPTCTTCSPDSQQTIYAPTIGVPELTGGDIVLNCRSPHAIEATPTFYTAEGEAIIGDVIRLQPAEIRFVAIESLIPEEHRNRHIWGGMSLSYTGGLLQVWAQITLHGLNGIGSADVTFSVLNGRGSDVQEAVWWMPNGNSTAIIALGNSSSVPIHTRLQYSNGEAQEVDIAPFATRYIRRQRGNAVKLTTAGPAGSLKAAGFVTNNNQRFTSGIRFYDTQNAVQSHLFATNFKVRNHSSHLLLKNTTAASVTARPRFRPMSGTGSAVELAPVTLAAGEIVELDLRPLIAAAETRNDLDSVNVQIENTGLPGSLIGALYSTDRTTDVTQDVPLRDSGVVRNSTGAYPWRLDGDYTSVVSITNVGNETAQFGATIRYNGGQYTLQPRELNVGQTAVFDIKRIRDEQRPDAFGNVIPTAVTSGQFSWSLIRNSGTARLIGRSEVTSKSRRDNRSYSCPRCCPSSGPLYSVPSIIVNFGGFSHFGVNEGWTSCDGVTDWYLGGIPGLYSEDTSIATANMVQAGTMRVDGIDVGDTTWSSELYHYWYWYSDGLSECYLNDFDMTSNGGVGVNPTVTIAGFNTIPLDSSGVSGVTKSIQLTATGTPSGGTYSWESLSPRIRLSNTSSRTVTVESVAASQGIDDIGVTVIYIVNGRIATATHAITVVKPTFLEFLNTTRNPDENDCGTYRSFVRRRTYRTLDQFRRPIAGYTVFANESFDLSGISGNCRAGTIRAEGGLHPSDLVVDRFEYCNDACAEGFACSIGGIKQSLSVNGFPVQLDVGGITYLRNQLTITCNDTIVIPTNN